MAGKKGLDALAINIKLTLEHSELLGTRYGQQAFGCDSRRAASRQRRQPFAGQSNERQKLPGRPMQQRKQNGSPPRLVSGRRVARGRKRLAYPLGRRPDPGRTAHFCRDEVAPIEARPALINQLQQALYEYNPTALEAFDDWVSPGAWALVETFPDAQALKKASKRKWEKFLHSRRLYLPEGFIVFGFPEAVRKGLGTSNHCEALSKPSRSAAEPASPPPSPTLRAACAQSPPYS